MKVISWQFLFSCMVHFISLQTEISVSVAALVTHAAICGVVTNWNQCHLRGIVLIIMLLWWEIWGPDLCGSSFDTHHPDKHWCRLAPPNSTSTSWHSSCVETSLKAPKSKSNQHLFRIFQNNPNPIRVNYNPQHSKWSTAKVLIAPIQPNLVLVIF